MIRKILCKLGGHNWRPAGSVCVYGDGKLVGPFMTFKQKQIKVRRFYECRRCNERKVEISDAQQRPTQAAPRRRRYRQAGAD